MIIVANDPFNAGELQETLRTSQLSCGAIVSFIGTVRDINEGESVTALTLEHYPGMTESVLQSIVEQAKNRFGVSQIDIYHRIGTLTVNEPIVYVAVASQHRAAAFQACEFVMDFLKTEAPFWKKEHRAQGEAVWLEQAAKEAKAKSRWL